MSTLEAFSTDVHRYHRPRAQGAPVKLEELQALAARSDVYVNGEHKSVIVEAHCIRWRRALGEFKWTFADLLNDWWLGPTHVQCDGKDIVFKPKA